MHDDSEGRKGVYVAGCRRINKDGWGVEAGRGTKICSVGSCLNVRGTAPRHCQHADKEHVILDRDRERPVCCATQPTSCAMTLHGGGGPQTWPSLPPEPPALKDHPEP